MEVREYPWGSVGGRSVKRWELVNRSGAVLSLTNYGATITAWKVDLPGTNNASIVLGFDTLEEYIRFSPYFGCTVGRCANRIAFGQFALNGEVYTLATNNGQHHLHGGERGFDKVVWDVVQQEAGTLTLQYFSPDGEEGYPGNLLVTVQFSFTNDDEIIIAYRAETDKPTPVNLTNHSYFNLSGNVNNTILGHQLWLNADHFTPVDEQLIPTGEIRRVMGTPFDFTTPSVIGDHITGVPGGFDHNFVLNTKGDFTQCAARLEDAQSGRTLEVYTTEPGIQFYSGNFLDGSIHTSNGQPVFRHAALCLETQHFPDAVHYGNFPSVLVHPNAPYRSLTKYKLSRSD